MKHLRNERSPSFSKTRRYTDRSIEIRPYKFLIRKFCRVLKIIYRQDELDARFARGISPMRFSFIGFIKSVVGKMADGFAEGRASEAGAAERLAAWR